MSEVNKNGTKPAMVDYRAWLEREYLARRGRNAAYSIRRFAAQLGVSKTTLNDSIAGKRHLSRKNAEQVAARLGWSPLQREQALSTIGRLNRRTLVHPETCLTDDTFRLIADWYHYAILNLIKLKTHRATPQWIASRLGISREEAADAVDRLMRLGFMKRTGGRFARLVGSLDINRGVSSEAIRRYHRQNLHLAEASLDRDSVEDREFGSVTVAIDAERLARARKIIADFRRKIAVELESPNPDRVYHLSLQFFPFAKARIE